MNVFFHNEDVKIEVKEKRRIRKWIENTIRREEKEGDTINIILTSSNNIQALNKKHLKRNYITDIIAFNYNKGNIISGDLFLNPDTIKENSEKYKVKFSEREDRNKELVKVTNTTPEQRKYFNMVGIKNPMSLEEFVW